MVQIAVERRGPLRCRVGAVDVATCPRGARRSCYSLLPRAPGLALCRRAEETAAPDCLPGPRPLPPQPSQDGRVRPGRVGPSAPGLAICASRMIEGRRRRGSPPRAPAAGKDAPIRRQNVNLSRPRHRRSPAASSPSLSATSASAPWAYQNIDHIAAVADGCATPGPAGRRRPSKRRAPPLSTNAPLDGAAVQNRPVQRRPPISIACVHGRAAFKGGADARRISRSARRTNGGARPRRRQALSLACHRRSHARAGDGFTPPAPRRRRLCHCCRYC